MSSTETTLDFDADPAVSTRSAARFSELLWNLRWCRVLPHGLGNGLVVEASDFERAKPFIAEHYAKIFEETDPASPFSNARLTPAKSRYYERADFLEFKDSGRTVGLLVGAPHDWSTYYVRSSALLPEYQGSAIIQRFFTRVVFGFLRSHGVERVEIDVSPSNLAMVHILTRMRFNATGTALTERWGANLRFTKYLEPENERTFLRQFCTGVKYQLREQEVA